MSFLTTNDDVRLYFREWGTGRTVVLLHGWPLSADTWDDVAIALADAGYRVISYDRRGFGRSAHPWSGYDYNTLADDLKSVLQKAGASDATIVGFSMGGGEVVRYMSRHDGRGVVQTALVASVVPYMLKTADNPHGVDSQVFADMSTAIKADRPAFFGTFFDNFYGTGDKDVPVSQEVRNWSTQIALQANLKATLACINAFATTDFRPDLVAMTTPTLVIHGDADQIVPIDASARAVSKELPEAQLVEYPRGPHGLFATHKQQLARDLLKFLNS